MHRVFAFLLLLGLSACTTEATDGTNGDSGMDDPLSGGVGGDGTGGMGGAQADAAQPVVDAASDAAEPIVDSSTPVVDSGDVDASDGSTSMDEAFVPDVPNTYVGTLIDPMIELTAHSIVETADGPVWLAAVQNNGTATLCVANMVTTFLDVNGAELATASPGAIRAPLYRSNAGAGSLTECLGPGDIGMVVDEYSLQGVDTTLIASMTYELGALNIIDAVPAKTEVTITVEVTPSTLGGNHFTGLVQNHGSETLETPWVYVFGVNSVGRPIIAGDDILSEDIAPGGSAPYETYGSFTETVTDTVAFISP